MNLTKGPLLLGVIIALLLIPAAAAAVPVDGAYITVTGDVQKYKGVSVQTIDALDPLDTGKTSVTLESTEAGDLKAIEYPLLDSVTRTFDPASGTYHGAHVTVAGSKTVSGSTLPREYQVYTATTIPSFTVNVLGNEWGNVLLVECPENLDGNGDFEELFNAADKKGYLFAKNSVAYYDGNKFAIVGGIRADQNDLNYTLNENTVELSSFSFDYNNFVETYPDTFNKIPKPLAGEYLLTAVKYDSAEKTMHVLAAMPVLILDEDTKVDRSSGTGGDIYYHEQGDVTISFKNTDVNKIAYALVKKDTNYDLTVEINTSKLVKQRIPTSPVDAISILKNIAKEDIPATYALTCDGSGRNVDYKGGSCLAIVEGYGCSGANDAQQVTIAVDTLKKLDPGTYYLYALGMMDQKVVAVDQKFIRIDDAKPYAGGDDLPIGTDGKTTESIVVLDDKGIASLRIASGVKALDANGKALANVTISSLSGDAVPPLPTGATFELVKGCAYEFGPDGATFDPPITLTFEIPEDVWKTLDLNGHGFKVKWYNKQSGKWEDILTKVIPGTRWVEAEIEHFSTFALFKVPTTPEPKPTQSSGGGGGGGGGSGSPVSPEPPISYEEKGSLMTDSNGIMARSVVISAADKVASLFVPSGVKALDANGNPLSEISINPISSSTMPAVPAGAVYNFAGYVYEAKPDGATFDPAITLTLDIPEDAWNALDLNGQKLVVKWYNKQTRQWEDVPTTVSWSRKSVTAKISHFSTYALFTEPVTTTTPTDIETPTQPTTPTDEEPPAEGLPLTTILIVIVVIAIIAAAGYFFFMKKE